MIVNYIILAILHIGAGHYIYSLPNVGNERRHKPMPKPKHETYKVTMPNGNVETYKNEFDMSQMTVLQDIAEDLVHRFGSAAGCKVQRVKA